MTEVPELTSLEDSDGVFGIDAVRSDSGRDYQVEIRHLEERVNTCSCFDFLTAQLGTCKHIEGTLNLLKPQIGMQRSTSPQNASSRIEFYLPADNLSPPIISAPTNEQSSQLHQDAKRRLQSFIEEPSDHSLDRLRQLAGERPNRLRVSHLLESWKDRQQIEERAQTARETFLAGVKSGDNTFDVLRFQLFPY